MTSAEDAHTALVTAPCLRTQAAPRNIMSHTEADAFKPQLIPILAPNI